MAMIETLRPKILLTLCCAAMLSGCSSSWVYTFQEAEHRFERNPKPRLIFFKDHLDPASGRMEISLDDSQVKSYTRDMIRCKLVAQGSGNWSYVGRYGVDRFPAVIVIHPDGTYHALLGERPASEVAEFLASARPPGQRPKSTAESGRPRSEDWLSDYQDAIRKQAAQNRKLLLVYKWWSSEPSAEMLRRLQLPAVRSAAADMLVCVLDIDYPPNRQSQSLYGTTTVPALVLLSPGRSPRVLNGLQKPEDILRFLRGG